MKLVPLHPKSSNSSEKLNQPKTKMRTEQRFELLDDMECVVATADRLEDLAYANVLDRLRRPVFYDNKIGHCVEAPQKERN